MGLNTTRCMQVHELVHELNRHDGDLLVRIRDGDAVLPGVYVMRDDRTDHIDIGCPYAVRERLAEIDAAVRKADGRPKRRGPKVWVLIRRYELEDNAQQTECCDTFVFTNRTNAVRKAASLLRADIKTHGQGFAQSDVRVEEKAMLANFRTKFPRHLVQLSFDDSVVYELYRKGVR